MGKISTATSYWTYMSNFCTDCVLFIFATFLMDSIFVMFFKYRQAAMADVDIDPTE